MGAIQLSKMALDREKASQIAAQQIRCPSILAVIVLYRMDPFQAPVFRSLLASASAQAPGDLHLKILMYDNTPNGRQPHSLPDYVEYVPAKQNDGLAGAYNYALGIAETEGFDWLLTLDQDSRVPVSILPRLAALARSLQGNEQVVAIVPHLLEDAKSISPLYVGYWRPSKIPQGFSGLPDREICAMNSAATWRVAYLREVGGFDSRFWLDYLDYAMHRCAFRAGKLVYIAPEIVVQHELSTLDLGKRMSPTRFENVLLAESAFADLYKNSLERAILPVRWARECFRYMQRGDDLSFVRSTLRAMLRRLFRSRRYRLAQWQKSVSDRERSANVEQQVVPAIDTGAQVHGINHLE
jgi:GT2 family glycosyltransferase